MKVLGGLGLGKGFVELVREGYYMVMGQLLEEVLFVGEFFCVVRVRWVYFHGVIFAVFHRLAKKDFVFA